MSFSCSLFFFLFYVYFLLFHHVLNSFLEQVVGKRTFGYIAINCKNKCIVYIWVFSLVVYYYDEVDLLIKLTLRRIWTRTDNFRLFFLDKNKHIYIYVWVNKKRNGKNNFWTTMIYLIGLWIINETLCFNSLTIEYTIFC